MLWSLFVVFKPMLQYTVSLNFPYTILPKYLHVHTYLRAKYVLSYEHQFHKIINNKLLLYESLLICFEIHNTTEVRS